MVKVLSMAGYPVFCIFPSKGPLIEGCRPYIEGYAFIQLPWWFGNTIGLISKMKLLRNIFLSSIQIKRYIRKINVQKVIVNTIAIPGPAIAGRLASVPVYWFLHELGNDGFNLLFGEKFSKRLIGMLAKKVICNSQYTLSHYKTFISSKKLSCAYQSVNIDLPAKRVYSSSVNYGLVGRLCPQKAQREAAEAMVFMKDEQAKLWLIGPDNNDYGSKLKSWVVEKGLDENIIFAGENQNIREMYAMLDAIVVCSRNEALGRTTIEAMKCGLPVIAPNQSGHSELIQNGRNGYYYQLGNPEDLALKMKILLNRETCTELGDYGKRWAHMHFNDQRFADMLIESLNS